MSNIIAGNTETGENQIDAIDGNCWFRYNGTTINGAENRYGIGLCRVDPKNGYRCQILLSFEIPTKLYCRYKVGSTASWPQTFDVLSFGNS